MNKDQELRDPVTTMPVETQAIAGNTFPANDQYEAEIFFAPAASDTAPSFEDRLELGIPVLTADGKQLGKVGDLAAQHFKVHRSIRSDYWIEDSNIADVDDRGVVVTFTRDDLESYKLDHPQAADVMLDTEEQRQQRAAMEAELERQNRELAETH